MSAEDSADDTSAESGSGPTEEIRGADTSEPAEDDRSTLRSHDVLAIDELGQEEIVLGLVAGTGAELDPFVKELDEMLHAYDYDARVIRLSELLHDFEEWQTLEGKQASWVSEHQDAGDALRTRLDSKDAMAELAMSAVRARRDELLAGDEYHPRTAWVLRTLKRPEEIEALRRVYRSRFLLMSVHVPEQARRESLRDRLEREGWTGDGSIERHAIGLIERDQEDHQDTHGQNMRATFPLAEFFVDASSVRALADSLDRITRLIFGDPFATPTRDEHAMAHAHIAALRSAEMGRQVGAAIMTPNGEIVAVGTNEVPSPAGGLYWGREERHPDEVDQRDFIRQVDANDLWKRKVAEELLGRMRDTRWIAADHSDGTLDELLVDLSGTRLRALIEFGRAVHAEMDALTNAAQRGVAVDGTTLVTTTFPCHNCTRHVIAAGIRRLVFIHPYGKSLARELHSDAVDFDPATEQADGKRVRFEQFIGVGPTAYERYYTAPERKDDLGRPLDLRKRDAIPRVLWPEEQPVQAEVFLAAETDEIDQFQQRCADKGLKFRNQEESG
ncbi:MAG: deaminase [Actinomycetota bacterium]|nr:deaminase [Actinomycetota bacterium]